MKIYRITCRKHLLIVLISIFFMCYVKPKPCQFPNSVLVRRGGNVKTEVTAIVGCV